MFSSYKIFIERATPKGEEKPIGNEFDPLFR